MSRLRQRLWETYAEHYAQGEEVKRNPTAAPTKLLRAMDLTYGPLLQNLAPNSKVLDLGAGTGFLLHWLSKQSGIVPVGVESTLGQVEIARKYLPNLEIVAQDGLTYLREHPNTFAGIFCLDVLEHIPEDILLEWIEAVETALLPGGFFLCRVPNAANLCGPFIRYIDLTHERSFTSYSLLQLLAAGGLREGRVHHEKSATLAGKFRLWLERTLHRFLFKLCSAGYEPVYTLVVHAVAYRRS